VKEEIGKGTVSLRQGGERGHKRKRPDSRGESSLRGKAPGKFYRADVCKARKTSPYWNPSTDSRHTRDKKKSLVREIQITLDWDAVKRGSV